MDLQLYGIRSIHLNMSNNSERSSNNYLYPVNWDRIAAYIFHVPNLLLLDLVHAVLKVILLGV